MTIKKDQLGDRMKERYEGASQTHLLRRVPVIIRIDGKAFHTFTRGFVRPFDDVLKSAMHATTKALCEQIQGCVFAYTQSDEITLVLTDYATIQTDAWFGYNVQKMTSIASSIATLAFNRAMKDAVDDFIDVHTIEKMDAEGFHLIIDSEEAEKLYSRYNTALQRGALFDARVFSMPKDEVCNCLIWRQQDATRNSIESVGQAYFSAKQLHGKSCNEIQDMLFTQKGINWNDYPTMFKRGSCCIKQHIEKEMEDPRNPGQIIQVTRRVWTIDTEIPIFTQNRAYIEDLI